MTALRKPLLLLAVIVLVLAFLIEAGSLGFMPVGGAATPSAPQAGYGIAALAIFDALLLLTIGLIAAPMVVSQEAIGRTQGLLTFAVACLVLGLAAAALIRAVFMLYLMLGLLMVFIPYAVLWADFPVAAAGLTLTGLLLLKAAAGVCLVLAHPKFLTNKGLVALMLFSICLTMLVSGLQAFPPRVLASIGDTIASIVVLILTLVWAAVFALASLPAVKKAIKG